MGSNLSYFTVFCIKNELYLMVFISFGIGPYWFTASTKKVVFGHWLLKTQNLSRQVMSILIEISHQIPRGGVPSFCWGGPHWATAVFATLFLRIYLQGLFLSTYLAGTCIWSWVSHHGLSIIPSDFLKNQSLKIIRKCLLYIFRNYPHLNRT